MTALVPPDVARWKSWAAMIEDFGGTDEMHGSGHWNLEGDPVPTEAGCAAYVAMTELTSTADLDATVHMAARIVVPESVELPYEYYRDNVAKSLEMFDELTALGKPRILFSSTASLYALTPKFEVTEEDAVDPTSPYARTKRMMEQVLEDLAKATDLRAIILRYFNPIGADPDLTTGYHLRDATHVVPLMAQTALGYRESFTLTDRKSTRLNSSHTDISRMPSSA